MWIPPYGLPCMNDPVLSQAGRWMLNRRDFLRYGGTGLSAIALTALLSKQRLLAQPRQPWRPAWSAERPHAPRLVTSLRRVAVEILATQSGSAGAVVRDVIHREMAKRLRIDPTVKKAMAEAFAVVLEQFRDATLRDSVVLESVRRQIHGVTGGQMLELAQRLREAAMKSLELTRNSDRGRSAAFATFAGCRVSN